ncbi:glycosyltransferase [Paenibacillus sp. FSL W8-1187]|uniref:glycosyltransferase family A protein n=1 Tax=Paenibacillus sp. FSL W8-1187 TaxID=2975339 RepID=UPI0030DB6298
MDLDYISRPDTSAPEAKNMGTTDNPLISIITPFYNSGNYLRDTANSVFSQTFPFFEWIIVDDGSTVQADIELLERIQEADPRVRVFRKENGGISSARNLGIKNAETDLIVSLDADDLIEPTFLECGFLTLYTNPHASWCYSDSFGFGKQNYVWKKPYDPVLLQKENYLIEIAMMRKEALLLVGGYDESEKYFYEDWHLWLKYVRQGLYPVRMSFCGAWYRRTDEGVLDKVRTGNHENAMKLIKDVVSQIDVSAPGINYPVAPSAAAKATADWSLLLSELGVMSSGGRILHVVGRLDYLLDIETPALFREATVIALEQTSCEVRKQLETRMPMISIYELDSFLHIEQWPAFIHYFLASRSIDTAYISEFQLVYELIPWLKTCSPKTKFVKLALHPAPAASPDYLDDCMDSDFLQERSPEWNALLRCSIEAGYVRYIQSKLRDRCQTLEQENQGLETSLLESHQALEEQKKWSQQLQESKNWLERGYAEQQTSLAKQKSWTDELEKAKAWLVTSNQAKEDTIQELKDWIRQLEEGKTWLEEQLRKANAPT